MVSSRRLSFSAGRVKEKTIQTISNVDANVVAVTDDEFVERGLIDPRILGDSIDAKTARAHRVA